MQAAVVTTFDAAPRYTDFPTPAPNSADEIVVGVRRSVVLPADTDPLAVAAAMNPAMSCWIALRRRIAFSPGQKVLVLGAAGNAEKLAALSALGATDTVVLDAPDALERLGHIGRDVDVVVAYLWGQPTADALAAVIPHRLDDSQQLTWVQVGSVTGLTAPIPSAVLRAARLQIVGSGQGSVSTGTFSPNCRRWPPRSAGGTFRVDARPVPLRDVELAWTDTRPTHERTLLVPQS